MKKNEKKTNHYLDGHGIMHRRIRDGSNIFHTIMVPRILQPYILYESSNALGQIGSTRLYYFIRRHYYWKKLHQNYNKCVHACPEWQQVTLKEAQYKYLPLPIPQFPMSFISIDILGPYCETKKVNQYALFHRYVLQILRQQIYFK